MGNTRKKETQEAIRARRFHRLAVVINECFEAGVDFIFFTELMDLYHDANMDVPMQFPRIQSFSPFVIRTANLAATQKKVGRRVRQGLTLGLSASRFVFEQLGIDTSPNLEKIRKVNEAWRVGEPDTGIEFEPYGDSIFHSALSGGAGN